MISALSKSCGLGLSAAATSVGVASAVRPIAAGVYQKTSDVILPPPQKLFTSDSLSRTLAKDGFLQNKASVGITSSTQYRLAHTDVRVPDFSDYRAHDVRTSSFDDNQGEARRAFTYLVLGGGTATGAYAAKAAVTDLIMTMSASADVLALAKIEVKLSDIPEGKNITLKWRGKPLFVRHRTGEEIETEQGVDPGTLRDQEHDNVRVKNPEWLVVLGVCTHLGCVPIPNMGEWGGYFCPCHGSHYDASGRIRKGPAPLNLEVPEYEFTDDTTIMVG